MFQFIGFLVVTGFALYGAKQFFIRHVVSGKAGSSDTGAGA